MTAASAASSSSNEAELRIGEIAVDFEHEPATAVLGKHGKARVHDDFAPLDVPVEKIRRKRRIAGHLGESGPEVC